MRALLHGAARGLGALLRQPLATIGATLAIATAVSIVLLAATSVHNLRAVSSAWSRHAGMVVFLEDGLDRSRVQQIGAALSALPMAEEVAFVTPGQALGRVRAMFGDDSEVSRGIERDMLPASFEVTWRSTPEALAQAPEAARLLESAAGVAEVVHSAAWQIKVAKLTSALERAGRWLWLLAALGGGYLLLVTVGLRQASAEAAVDAHSRRTWHMLGASSWFVRGPQVVEGAALALLGAALGAAIAYGLFLMVRAPIASVLVESFGALDIAFVPSATVGQVIAIAAILGAAVGGVRSPKDPAGAIA